MNRNTNHGRNAAKTIVVRSIRVSDNNRVEWTADAKTWRAAWDIVAETFTPREECKVFQASDTTWVIDIQG